MDGEYLIAVVGSGPAGMSAAARAAKKGQSHVLLERMPHHSHTVFDYPKRKHVMAAPQHLPVRSDLPFAAGTREDVLDSWNRGLADARVNVRYKSEVTAIEGERGHFTIRLADGDTIAAANVVLATGTSGNPRKLEIPGADDPRVQYALGDAADAAGETVVVIGAGDSALEDALLLAERNEVVIVNRGADFRRAKPANAARIAAAIAGGAMRVFYQAKPVRIEARQIVLDTEDGETSFACDRIIARLGTTPPRAMLEACGLHISGDGYPPLSAAHESSIPGLYIVGALAGYPLIKHGLKQGCEVVEHILGNRHPLADQKRLVAKLEEAGAAEFVARLRQRIPRLAPLGIRQLCEFLLHAEIRRVAAGEILYRDGDYTSALYWVVEGVLALDSAEPGAAPIVFVRGDVAGAAEFRGGRRRSGTLRATAPSLLIEAGRAAMAILLRAEPELRQTIDEIAIANLIALRLAPGIGAAALAELVRTARALRLKPGETLAEDGAADTPLYLIRKGSATVSRRSDGREIVLSYLSAGATIGEFAWLAGETRGPAIRAAALLEVVRIDGAALRRVSKSMPALRQRLADAAALHLGGARRDPRRQGLVRFLLDQGLGEATDALVIDDGLCVGCNNCETACAETHGGLSALDRGAGARHGTLHLPGACRHCENAHCLSDCPTDSIRRAPGGAVYIDDSCTGCGHCERNCPYGAIRMAAAPEPKSNLLLWLLFGWGSGPGEDKAQTEAASPENRHAVKCDMCRGLDGPACVSACPTGAAIRVNPAEFIRSTLRA